MHLDIENIYYEYVEPYREKVNKLPKLSQEIESGNIEHKRHLINQSKDDIDGKSAQMKWRIFEGKGEAIYYIGIEDDGNPSEINCKELCESIYYLKMMSELVNASLVMLKVWFKNNSQLNNGFNPSDEAFAAKCLVKVNSRKTIDHITYVKVSGPYDSGKSTLISVLINDELDDGEGTQRMSLFKHQHEMESGDTSSITLASLCFDKDGCVIPSREIEDDERMTPIIDQKEVYSIINLCDMPGPGKYARTLFNGLSRINSTINLLVFNCSQNPQTLNYSDHLLMSYLLGNKIIIVLNCYDLSNHQTLIQHLELISKLIAEKMTKRIPVVIESNVQAEEMAKKFCKSKRNIPIFVISCVTAKNITILLKFLSLLRHSSSKNAQHLYNKCKKLFDINDVIIGKVGTVIEGDMLLGSIKINDRMKIGPDSDGDFTDINIVSMKRNFENCEHLNTDQNGTLKISPFIKKFPLNIRRGMVLTDPEASINVCTQFLVKIILLKNSSAFKLSQDILISIGNIQQTVKVISLIKLDSGLISAKLKFMQRPEIVYKNQRFILNDGANKGVGIITSTL